MTSTTADWPNLDYTVKGIQFAPWPTDVANDSLYLGRIRYENKSPLAEIANEGLTLSLPRERMLQTYKLEATFISLQRRSVIRFGFSDVIAFRVLDENALLDLWHASELNPRPAHTTFRARGHQWQAESFLAFMSPDNSPRFSYFIATEEECLEVVCKDEPVVSILGPAIVVPERIE